MNDQWWDDMEWHKLDEMDVKKGDGMRWNESI